MKLVYASDKNRPVTIGDRVLTFRGEECIVQGFVEPHKPSSTGFVYVIDKENRVNQFYPSVIGAVWIV